MLSIHRMASTISPSGRDIFPGEKQVTSSTWFKHVLHFERAEDFSSNAESSIRHCYSWARAGSSVVENRLLTSFLPGGKTFEKFEKTQWVTGTYYGKTKMFHTRS